MTPPTGYAGPSTVAPEVLAGVKGPDGAYLISDGSFGKVFTVAGVAPIQVDLPVDPSAAPVGTLVAEKTASIRQASPGDFIQYRVAVRDIGSAAAKAVTIDDALPVGLRYKVGSTRGTTEAVVSADGRGMRFALPAIAAGGTATITLSRRGHAGRAGGRIRQPRDGTGAGLRAQQRGQRAGADPSRCCSPTR